MSLSMSSFIHRHFLLGSSKAIELYERYARDLPIVDYHCHLEPEQVSTNACAKDIVDLWLSVDPYKWRAMRINGIEERFITGAASPDEKFRAFANTVPRLVGSPVFHWSALELKRYFGIDLLLNGDTAEDIWKECNEQIRSGGFGTADILNRSNVEIVCTSDNWLSDLRPHESTRKSDSAFTMLPSLRGDAALQVDSLGYADWIQTLGVRVNREINSISLLKESLVNVIDDFDRVGCCLSDHSFESVSFCMIAESDAKAIFEKALAGDGLSCEEACGLKSYLLVFLAKEYAERNWTLQLHLGACRKTSSNLMNRVSIPGGIACVGDSISSVALSQFFDCLEGMEGMPRVIVYPLNVGDFEKIASLSGAFVEEGVWGKVQLGPPWWFNDHYEGIVHQLKVFANYSALGRFVGMATDTRSPLSMARFEYFRRILCNLLGKWIDAGMVPDDEILLENLIGDICYKNAVQIVGSRPVQSEVASTSGTD